MSGSVEGDGEGRVLKLEERAGRVALSMTVQRMGRDCTVHLFGGDAHVGAVALALPHGLGQMLGAKLGDTLGTEEGEAEAVSTDVLAVPGHREDALARTVAQRMAGALRCRVCVVCGFHLDDITRDEIALVLALADKLTHRALQKLAECTK